MRDCATFVRMKRIEKNYKKWMGVKAKVNCSKKLQRINEGDVVWVAVGENVGVEIDGKGQKYSRPVLVLKKHTNRSFTGVPLTSKQHNGTWYTGFEFQGKKQVAVLVQTRLMDTARVYSRMGRLSRKDYSSILNNYVKLIVGKKYALAYKLGSD